jgi:Tfp pilus assembly protein PilF
MPRLRYLALLPGCLMLSGCASFRNFNEDVVGMFATKGQRELEVAVKAYEDGEYAYAARLLQASLDSGLRGAANQTRAHKYLAFLHCAANRTQQCRDEFRKALDVDPSFDLRDDEAGHPVWGPVFRSLKTPSRK